MVQVVQVRVRPPRGYMDHVPSQPTSDMLSVLVVEDDRELRETLSLFLRDCGCYVTAAAGGVEGLQAVILDAFDVVVTDIELHGGEWFWREATTLRPGLRGRFIFCTGEHLSPGVDGPTDSERFILKPIRAETLWQQVQAVGARGRNPS